MEHSPSCDKIVLKMTKRKEEPVRPESKAGREVRVMSAMVRAGDALYRAYWLSLSPRDRERLPEP